MLRDCEGCNRRFAVLYQFSAPRVPSPSSDRVNIRVVRCPSCGHLNPLVMLMYAHHVVVKSLQSTRRQRIVRQLMVAATGLIRPFRPLLP